MDGELRTAPAGRSPVRLLRHVSAPRVWAPVALVAIGYGALLPTALSTPLVAAAGLVLLTGLVVTLTIGPERTSAALFVLAFLLAPMASLNIGSRYFLVADIAFIGAVALALPRLLHRRLRLPAMFVVGSLLFTVMGLIAIPLAASPIESFVYIFSAVVALVLMPAVVVWMEPTDRQMFAMLIAFGIGTAISTLVGIPRNEYRNSGLTYHPVALGYTAMLTLSFVPFLIASKARLRWVLVPPLALVALLGIQTSGSRTGVVVILALALLIPLLERSVVLVLGLAAAGVFVLPKVLTFDPEQDSTSALARLLGGGGGASGSDNVRLQTLRDAWQQIQDNPVFGNGYSVEHTYTIHNIYLQVLAAEGIIGLVGLLLMFGALVVPLLKATSPRRHLAYPAVAVILAGPFQPNMADHYLALTLGLSLVAAVGVLRQEGDPPSPARSTGSADVA